MRLASGGTRLPSEFFRPLVEVYELLRDLLSEIGLETGYRAALGRMIEAAWSSDQTGYCYTLLPLLTCQAAGGHLSSALPAAAAWRALHMAAKVLDDVEDGDVSHLTNAATAEAQVVNLGTGLIALAQLALVKIAEQGRPDVCLALLHDVNATVLRAASGQHLDITSNHTLCLREYWRLIEDKSAAGFALAARAGARCAGASPASIERFSLFGHYLGMLIQIADDLIGFYTQEPWGDLRSGKRPLPVVYGLEVASSSERALLEEWLKETTAQAQANVVHMVRSLGGDAYAMAQMARFFNHAQSALEQACQREPRSEPLYVWFEEVFGAGWPLT